HFGLGDCLVVPSDDGARSLIDRLGAAGGQALSRIVKSGDTIAVAWGRTVLAIAEQTVSNVQDVTVVQATGGTRANFAYTPELCAAAMATAINGRLVNITAPALVKSRETYSIIMQEPLIADQFQVLQAANKII